MADQRRPYHHGDARNALLGAATELLEQAGAHDLSLRRVAERAGLSRQAPYNHFRDREALLATLVADGFGRLAAYVSTAGTAIGDEPALASAAAAYLDFAHANPALFRLMFTREIVDVAAFPDAASAARTAFVALESVVATIAPPGRVPELSLAAWCLVHGHATLVNEGTLTASEDRHARAAAFARLIGLAATA